MRRERNPASQTLSSSNPGTYSQSINISKLHEIPPCSHSTCDAQRILTVKIGRYCAASTAIAQIGRAGSAARSLNIRNFRQRHSQDNSVLAPLREIPPCSRGARDAQRLHTSEIVRLRNNFCSEPLGHRDVTMPNAPGAQFGRVLARTAPGIAARSALLSQHLRRSEHPGQRDFSGWNCS